MPATTPSAAANREGLERQVMSDVDHDVVVGADVLV